MRAKPEVPTPEPTVARGRQQALAVLVTLGGSIAVVAFLGGSTLPGMFVQLFVLVLLGVQLFRGVPWARWVVASMTAMGSLGNGYMAVTSYGSEGIGWIVNGSLALIYAWCAFMLVMSPAIQAFMEAQRAARQAAELP